MGDVEDAAESEVEVTAEAESVSQFTVLINRLKNQVISVARQLYCFSSVMMFPVFSLIIDSIPPKGYNINETDKQPGVKQPKEIMKYTDLTLVSITGIIVGGLLLYFIGRKYSVIATNLSHLAILSYSYLTSLKVPAPYNIRLINQLIRQAGFVAFFIYVAEITSPTLRPFFMGLYTFYHMLLEEKVTTLVKQKETSLLLRNGMIVAVVSSLLALFIPETPFWLTLKGNQDKAEKTFTWMRAGNSDRSEFDRMLVATEDIKANKLLKRLATETMAVGLLLSGFLVSSAFDPCDLMVVIMHDFYYPKDSYPSLEESQVMRQIVDEPKKQRLFLSFYGQLIFLLFSFVVPRKALYLFSYLFGVIVVVPLGLKMTNVKTSMKLSACCSMAPYLGIASLLQILPAEIYPAALREIGVSVTAILYSVYLYASLHSYAKAKIWFAVKWYRSTVTYFCFFLSLIGMPFIIIYMPETKDTHIYELSELKLKPLESPAKAPVDEGEDTESEGPMGDDESIAEVSEEI